MNKVPLVLAIVVTYNGIKWYDRCFSSLQKSSIPLDIFVVDNGSNDGSADYIMCHFPEVIISTSADNLGFGKANNIGLKYALEYKYDYVFLLNQDAWVEPTTIETLIQISIRNPEYGIIGPLQVDANKEKVLDGVINFLTYPGNLNKSLFSDALLGKLNDIYSVPEINAAAWLLPYDTINNLGGFDPLFLHYGEDWNYLSRAIYHGYKVGIAPNLALVHDCIEHPLTDKKYQNTFDKWLLQRATDLNFPENQVNIMIKGYAHTAIKKLLLFNFKAFGINFRNMLFLSSKRKDILSSRKKNTSLGPNWL